MRPSAGGVTNSALTWRRHLRPGGGAGVQRLLFWVSSTPGMTSIDGVEGGAVIRLWSVKTMKS